LVPWRPSGSGCCHDAAGRVLRRRAAGDHGAARPGPAGHGLGRALRLISHNQRKEMSAPLGLLGFSASLFISTSLIRIIAPDLPPIPWLPVVLAVSAGVGILVYVWASKG